MPVANKLEISTKEDILKCIKDAKCPKLKMIKHKNLTKEELITALQACNCPVIKKMCEQLVFV
jgi:hypothetical protein